MNEKNQRTDEETKKKGMQKKFDEKKNKCDIQTTHNRYMKLKGDQSANMQKQIEGAVCVEKWRWWCARCRTKNHCSNTDDNNVLR